MSKSKLTVYFEKPFWVAVYERVSDGKLEVCKVTFGAEPKDYDVYEYFLSNWNTLQFSKPVAIDSEPEVRINPKRMQRAIKKQLSQKGIGTKSQLALQSQQAEGKIARKKKSKSQKELEEQRKFQLHKERRKEKHKGH